MKIEIWSDYVCPFCYMGKRRLERALEQTGVDAEVVYRSFELDPNSPRDVGMDVYDMLSRKFGMSREQAIAMNDNMEEQAKADGLTYRFAAMVQTNTFDAHRLTHYAAAQGKDKELAELLFSAVFTDSLHVGDRDTLVRLASQAGLDPTAARNALDRGEYADAVREDEREASRLGVTGVPFFVINRKYAVSGAQPLSVFVNALRKAEEDEKPLILVQNDDSGEGNVCTDEACLPPDNERE